jgi:thioredoxin reductase (NADPH)
MTEIIVYGTDWCPDCISTKRFLTAQQLPFRAIDVDSDSDADHMLRQLQDGARRIPTVAFPDGTFLVEPGHDQLADKLSINPQARRTDYDIIIVGGGPAGLSAAIYAGRERYSTLVIDAASFGGQAVTTKQIDNYPGFPDGVGGGTLAELFVAQNNSDTTELLSATTVLSINRDEGDQIALTTSHGQTLRARAVLITTGTTYRTLNVPGEADLIGKKIHFCSTCDGPAYRGQHQLVVVGGGNSACEEALYLATLVDEVDILQNLPELTADAVLQERIRSHPNIRIHTGVTVDSFRPAPSGATVTVRKADDNSFDLTPDAVFVFIGLSANTSTFIDVLQLDPYGYIVTDNANRTSLPGVFAAGDVRAGSTKQLASAAGDAVSAFLNIKTTLSARSQPVLTT